jgi:hypothetical protein
VRGGQGTGAAAPEGTPGWTREPAGEACVSGAGGRGPRWSRYPVQGMMRYFSERSQAGADRDRAWISGAVHMMSSMSFIMRLCR